MKAYEHALEESRDEDERERLRAVKESLDVSSDSPEWTFYTLLVPPVRDAARTIRDAADDMNAKRRSAANVASNVLPNISVLMLIAISALIALSTWALTRSFDDAHYAEAAPQIGAYIATPGGRAAASLLRANGNGLALEMRACTPHTIHGRSAIACTFWADGDEVTSSQTPLEIASDAVTHTPAWPFALIGGLVISARALRKKKPTHV